MSAEFLQVLLETSLAAALAVLVVLTVRRPARRWFGARTAYALWWLVPVSLAAVMLPAPRAALLPMPPVQEAAARVGELVAAAPQRGMDVTAWILAAWSIGALWLAVSLARRQRRFRRELGELQRRDDGSWRSQSGRIGPAVIGAWRARVVVPVDFEDRYDVAERDLVLCHERVHVARRDLAFNLLATALRCAHWFNPLLHYAMGRFRFDQELAADALVLAQRPRQRREYADAMLKTQLLLDPPPLGCHWQSAHPLKERIMMLKHPLPGAARALSGAVFAAVLLLASGYAAWAAQPAQRDDVQTVTKDVTYNALKPPSYPASALAERVAGTVMLRVLVSTDGAAKQVQVETSSGDTRLDEAAMTTVRDWRFNAAKAGQQPTEQWVQVPITFSLNGPPTAEEAVPPGPNRLDEIYIAPETAG